MPAPCCAAVNQYVPALQASQHIGVNDLDRGASFQQSARLDGIVEGEYDALGIGDIDVLTPEQAAELVPNQDEARGMPF